MTPHSPRRKIPRVSGAAAAAEEVAGVLIIPLASFERRAVVVRLSTRSEIDEHGIGPVIRLGRPSRALPPPSAHLMKTIKEIGHVCV